MRAHRFIAPAVTLALVVSGLVLAIKTVLRLPGIPYNVSELFLDNGSVAAVTFFAVGLVWIGAGAMVVAILMAKSRRPYLVLPIAIVIASLISKMLISRGATYESLDDILGTNNIFGLVTQHGIWGTWWASAFARLGVDIVDFLERRVRYVALYSIPLVALVFVLLPHARRKSGRPHGRSAGAWAATAIIAILWLWASGTIVLTFAATDNLTELIAAPQYLFGALVAIACVVSLLIGAGRSTARWVSALAAWAAGVPITWWLINAGLEQHIRKYSVVFSGTQFLLGPDRQHTLDTATLFTRWAMLYTASVVVVAFGAWLASGLADAARSTSGRPTVPEAS